jgi:recombinational DNA repair protein (RecF pathway)
VEQALDTLTADPASLALRRAYELRLVSTLGFTPVLDRCVVCGAGAGDIEHLDLHRGGIVCATHARGAPRIGPKTRQWIEWVLAAKSLDPTPGVDAVWAQTAAERLGGATGAFYSVLLGRALKSAGMLLEVGL